MHTGYEETCTVCRGTRYVRANVPATAILKAHHIGYVPHVMQVDKWCQACDGTGIRLQDTMPGIIVVNMPEHKGKPGYLIVYRDKDYKG